MVPVQEHPLERDIVAQGDASGSGMTNSWVCWHFVIGVDRAVRVPAEAPMFVRIGG